VARACAAAADGRRAARALAKWCESFHLSEPEFQVLWLLGSGSSGFDQTMLAQQLVYSPAQVSATVDRLRTRGWIVQDAASGDRRRHLWRLTPSGDAIVLEMLSTADRLRCESAQPPREAAA
jgi:DNA-binding MarR family transcriptional regulator